MASAPKGTVVRGAASPNSLLPAVSAEKRPLHATVLRPRERRIVPPIPLEMASGEFPLRVSPRGKKMVHGKNAPFE
jgi:hypothetical protein